MQSREKLIERCLKLQRMSKETESSPHEAATALRRFRSIMDQNGILESDLEKSEFLESVVREGKSIPKWWRLLAFGVAKYNDCVIDSVRFSNRVAVYEFQGFETDVMVAKLMMDYLEECMHRGWDSFEKDASVHGKAARSSFNIGFAANIQKRLMQMVSERHDDLVRQSGQALVLRKDQLVQSKYGLMKGKSETPLISDGGAYNGGSVVGNKTSLASQLTHGAKVLALPSKV